MYQSGESTIHRATSEAKNIGGHLKIYFFRIQFAVGGISALKVSNGCVDKVELQLSCCARTEAKGYSGAACKHQVFDFDITSSRQPVEEVRVEDSG